MDDALRIQTLAAQQNDPLAEQGHTDNGRFYNMRIYKRQVGLPPDKLPICLHRVYGIQFHVHIRSSLAKTDICIRQERGVQGGRRRDTQHSPYLGSLMTFCLPVETIHVNGDSAKSLPFLRQNRLALPFPTVK